MSFRKRRVELQNSSGAEATGGGLAGWTGVSTCWTTHFPKRNKVFYSCWLSYLTSCGISRVGDLDVGAGVGERLERGGDFTEREGDFTETGDLGVGEDTRFTCRSLERRFNKEEETQL